VVPGNLLAHRGASSACLLDFGFAGLFAGTRPEISSPSADEAGFASLALVLKAVRPHPSQSSL
jgi:hypothetical protein